MSEHCSLKVSFLAGKILCKGETIVPGAGVVKLKQNLHTWWIGLQLMKRRWQRQKSKMP
jgi:hypothetical protein